VAASARKKKVLFVCIGNMCRSQMAEGFARSIAGDLVEPYSAGTNHTGEVSRQAMAAMEERGIDISRQYSKGLGDVPLLEMDYVVTMGCCSANELCPVTYAGNKIDWPIEDPIGRPIDVFRRVRDDIERRVRELLETIWKENNISSER
jgi:arsenate reductase